MFFIWEVVWIISTWTATISNKIAFSTFLHPDLVLIFFGYRLWTDLILQSEAIQDVLLYLFCELFRHEAVTSTHAFSLDFFQAWDWVSYSYFSSFLTKFRQLVHIHTVATCASPEKNKSKENTNREVLAGWRQERRWTSHLLLSQGFVCKSERILKSRQGVLGKIKEAMLMDWTYFEPLPGPLPLSLPIPITKD